ncbi:MAG: PQQ-dependent sugar dehydrogenase [Cyanobacteria bacterium J06626_23]
MIARKLFTNVTVCRLITLGSAIAVLGAASCAAQVPPESSTAQPENTDVAQSEPSTTESAEDPTTAEPTTTEPAEAPAATVNPEFELVTVIDNLEHPWGLAWLPEGELLITERPGRLRLVRDGVLDPTPITGLPEVFAEGQGGLMDVVIHPRFAENRLIYFTYSHGSIEANRTRIARATFDGSALSDVEVIFEVSQTKARGQHFGSRLMWLPDGTLLATIGDGGNPPIELDGELIRQQAQNRGSHFGKVLRLNDDGSVPSNNPFVADAEADPVLWSYGHRNIQGIAFDPIANRVWATEHGSRGGDELNLVEEGQNYGWPLATHSREYSGGIISPEQSLPGMVDPKVVWTPAIAPSGLAFYSGDRFPEWRGDLFAGGLVSQDIRHIEVDEAGTVLNEESISVGQRVRAVQQGPDELLYVLTDEPNGQLMRLEPVGG